MASESIHADVVRFESGGILTFTDGSDTLTVKNIVPGSLSFDPPMPQEGLDYSDRGVQQAAVQGDDGLGSLTFRTRGTKFFARNLINLLTVSNPASVNTMREWTVTIKNPDYRGATTGTVTILVARRKKVDFKAGTDFDEVGVEMVVRTWTAPAAYTGG